MTEPLAVALNTVSKHYTLGHEANPTLKEMVLRLGFRKRWRTPFKALDSVTVEIPWGQSVGIVGRNGSGKSTLLKLVAGITAPSSGTVSVSGKVLPLLELGAGFHPELTGRENIFLTGAVLGLSERVVRERLDEIVAFAELKSFIDVPVKHYSSGMFLRLGFSVGIQMDPDILVLDEVMAVGDHRFREKSAEEILRMQQMGKTVLFVSHDMASVRMLCQRVIWLEKGRVVFDGSPAEGIVQYRQALARQEHAEQEGKSEQLISLSMIRPGSTEAVDVFEVGEPLEIIPLFDPSLSGMKGTLVVEIQDDQGTVLHRTQGIYQVRSTDQAQSNPVKVRSLNLLPGLYALHVIFKQDEVEKPIEELATFSVGPCSRTEGQSGLVSLGNCTVSCEY